VTLGTLSLWILGGYALFLFAVARRAGREVSSVQDFFSYRSEHTLDDVIRTFEASNASFMTAFLALFLYGFSLGLATLWIPVGFCLGILFYAFYFLPKQSPFLRDGGRYPALLEQLTASRYVRPIAASFVAFSFWLFFFAEMQGALRFLRELLSGHPTLTWLLPVLLVAGMIAYIYTAGFQAVVMTDRIQLVLIRLGTLAMLVLVGWRLSVAPASVAATLERIPGLFAFPAFIVQTGVGFAFSQLLYYDNWLRLSLFFDKKRRPLADEEFDKAIRRLQRLYAQSALFLLVIYCVPVGVTVSELSHGHDVPGEAALVHFFVEAAQASPLGLLLAGLGLLHLLSALVSTADTYVISATASITEDLFRQELTASSATLAEGRSSEGEKPLEAVRFTAAVFAASVLPMAFTAFDFSTLFTYLFYSANGFVGPLCAILARARVSGNAVVASIGLGFLVPLAFLAAPPLRGLFDYSGVIVVAISLIIVYFGRVGSASAVEE
jgi:Na+/proline symporter